MQKERDSGEKRRVGNPGKQDGVLTGQDLAVQIRISLFEKAEQHTMPGAGSQQEELLRVSFSMLSGLKH